MKKILFITFIFLASFTNFAQVGIGTATPNTNAALDIDATNKGVLFTRVALTSTSATSPLSAHVAGMKVYNTATTGDVTSGMYYNDGTKWIRYSAAVPVFTAAKKIYVDTPNPNNATKFGENEPFSIWNSTTSACINNPAFINDASLANNSTYIYIGQTTCDENDDGSEFSYWISDGTNYISYEAKESSEWYISDSNKYAASNKENSIFRLGSIGVGKFNSANGKNKITTGHYTSTDATSSELTGSLNGIRIANNHANTNAVTSLYGEYTTNYNNSTNTMANLYGNHILNYNYGGKVSNLRGLSVNAKAQTASDGMTIGYGIISSITNNSTNTDDVPTMYGFSNAAVQNGTGRVTNLRGVTSTTTGSAISGGFNSGYGGHFVLTNKSDDTRTTSSMLGGDFDVNIEGAGVVTTTRGITSNVGANATSAGFTNGTSGSFAITNSSTSTDAITTLQGISVDANHYAAGKTAAFRGILSNATASATSGSFTSGTGISNTLANSSNSTDDIAAMYGYTSATTNNSPGKVINIRGITNAVTSGATSGNFTAGYGINNSFVSSGTSTTPSTTLYGMANAVSNNSAGKVTNLRGITSTVANSAANSAGFINGHGLHVSFDNDSEDLSDITIANGASINLTNYALAKTTTQEGITVINYGGNKANSGAATNMRGANFNTRLRTLNSGADNTDVLSGIDTSLTHAAAVNTENMSGIKSTSVSSGTGGVTTQQRGLISANIAGSSSTDSMTDLDGAFIDNNLTGKQSTTNMRGVYTENSIGSASLDNSITNLHGVYVLNTKSAASTTEITDSYGFYYANSDNGIATNDYGIYLEDIGSTDNDATSYAIYSEGGQSFFEDNVGIGTNQPTAKLDVNLITPETSNDFINGTVGSFVLTNSSTSTTAITKTEGLNVDVNHESAGKSSILRGINTDVSASATSGSFTNGTAAAFVLTNSSTSTAAITKTEGLNIDVNHDSAGKSSTFRGFISDATASAGSGGFTNGNGASIAITNASTSTNAVNTINGINIDANHNGKGKVSAFKGIITNATADATSGSFNSGQGISNTLVNSSASAEAIGTMYGYTSVTTNNSPGKVASIRGITNAVTSGAASGNFSAGYGINNSFISSGTSTEATTTLYGIANATYHHSKGRVNNLRGITSTVNNNGNSAAFKNGHGLHVSLDNDSTDPSLTSIATGANITVTNYGAANTTTQEGVTVVNYGGNKATSGAATNMRGANFNTRLRTLNTSAGATTDLSGIESALTHASVVDTKNMVGLQSASASSGSGGITTQQRGVVSVNTSASTSTNSMTFLDGGYFDNNLTGKQSATNMRGVYAENYIGPSSLGNSITNLRGLHVYNAKSAASTTAITNSYGFYYQNTNTGIATNDYGIYLEDVGTTDNDATSYSIYSAGGKSYFKDNVGVGTNNPVAKLDVNGAVKIGAIAPASTPTAGMIQFSTTDPNGGSVTGGHFWGYNGTTWIQLDN